MSTHLKDLHLGEHFHIVGLETLGPHMVLYQGHGSVRVKRLGVARMRRFEAKGKLCEIKEPYRAENISLETDVTPIPIDEEKP